MLQSFILQIKYNMEDHKDKNALFRIVLPGTWQCDENEKDILHISVDVYHAGIDLNLDKCKNELLLSSGHEGFIHFSYDGGPLTHNSSKTGKNMRINIIARNIFLFYVDTIQPSNKAIYKKIE